MKMNLTKNEKEVLKMLLDNGRIQDTEIAKKLKISTQAVGKIRKKLERDGIIKGYSCELDFEKLGINIFALSLSRTTRKFWEDFGEKGVKMIKMFPRPILTCMPSASDVSFIVLHGFRNAKEMDEYFHLTKTKDYEYGEFVKVYAFSPQNLLHNNPKELFKLVLDDKPILPPILDEERKKNI